MHLRLLTYNILRGGIGREALILRVLETAQADVILLQEVSARGTIDGFAKALGMQAFVVNDIAVLSRCPFVERQSYHSLPPINDTVLTAAVEAGSGVRLHVFGVHPVAFPGTFVEFWRNRQLTVARENARRYLAERCIIAGDFNAIAPGDRVLMDTAPFIMRLLYWLQRGKIYRSAIQGVVADGFVDCYRLLHPGGDGFTIPTPEPKLRLDYIFATTALISGLRTCSVVTEPPEVHKASDHYPLLAEFEL